ncbi:MAG TPA: hypothetical protein VKA35_07245 [Solirubrobacterales bacterium]|nr:hypothetical protein [Solirubrobacterales bacterium]
MTLAMARERAALCLLAMAVVASFALTAASGAVADDACPNEAFRTGKSRFLPDCRAYERVSPYNTSGAFVGQTNFSQPRNLFATEKISPDGSSVVFSVEGGALGEPPGGTGTWDVYESLRTLSGWQTVRRISPSGVENPVPGLGGTNSNHQYTFYFAGLTGLGTGTLGADGDANYLGNPDGTWELIGLGSLGTERLAEGHWITGDGTKLVFSTGSPTWCIGGVCEINQLEPNAPPTGAAAVYERAPDGPTRVVSLLPNEITPSAGEDATYRGVSRDASVIAFKIGETLYVRVDGEVTKSVVTGGFTFLGLGRTGKYLFYALEGNLYRFETATEATEQLTSSGDAQFVNVSEDGTHVYFVSPSQLDGTEGASGEPNLYMWAPADGIHFVATVASSDVPTLTATGAEPQLEVPGANASRLTPDGSVLAFQSAAQLTDYENAGHTQIFRYSASEDQLVCVSCNPRKEPAAFDARFQLLGTNLGVNPNVVIHNLTEDGSKIFFETEEQLSQRDVDGEVNDIYEWSATGGGGPALISTGVTPDLRGVFNTKKPTNTIYAVTRNGSDVIFGSWDNVIPEEAREGINAIFDARVGGGFPEPLAGCGAGLCAGAGSQPPSLGAAGSSSFRGKGNVRRKQRCRKHRKARRGAKKRTGCAKHKQAKRPSSRTGGSK